MERKLFGGHITPQRFRQNSECRVFKEGSICMGQREDNSPRIWCRDGTSLPISASRAFHLGVLCLLYREEYIGRGERCAVVEGQPVAQPERVDSTVLRYVVTFGEVGN